MKWAWLVIVVLVSVQAAYGYYDERNPTLVAYWPLNDGTNGQAVTTAMEIVGYSGHPATNGTSSGSGDSWFEDAERGIVYKKTVNDTMLVGTQGITTDFTWSIWVNVETNAHSGWIVMGNRLGSDNPWNKLTLGGLGNWATINPSGGWGVINGNWNHMALRRADGVVSVWINGVMHPTTVTQTNDFNGPLYLGGHVVNWNESLAGMLSDIAIWNEALSAERIQGLAAGAPVIIGPPAGTVLVVK